jgi:TonB-linked SusC/RagA family outer membrane protein
MKKMSIIKAIYCLAGIWLFTIGTVSAQTRIITGNVTDENNLPLIGVTVLSQEKLAGTITDFDGNYSITAEVGDTLAFSFIGYITEKRVVGDETIMDIQMLVSSQVLGEVEVVAYGVQKKVTITGAVSSVGEDELVRSPATTVANLLAGKVTGVSTVQTSGQPGADDPEIYIRGQGTYGDATPIYIVDGVERSFTQIDPNEIQSITVLKDASATAVYGIRGANGVIIVTTKRGKPGKAQINASLSRGVTQPTRIPEFATSHQYMLAYSEAQTNDGLTPADQQWRFQPSIVQAFGDNIDPIVFPNTDWMDYLIRETSPQTMANVSLSGGSQKASYFVSFGYLNQEGIFKNFDPNLDSKFAYNRYNYRSNLDIDITKSTKFGVTIGGVFGTRREPNSPNQATLFRDIFWSLPQAGPGIVDGKWIRSGGEYYPGEPRDGLQSFYGRGYSDEIQNRLNLDLDLRQDLGSLVKGLKFRTKIAYNTDVRKTKALTTNSEYYTPLYLAHVDPESPLYQQWDVIPGEGNREVVFQREGQRNPVSYSESRGKARDWYFDMGLEYNRKFGVHNVSGLLLYNQRKVFYPTFGNGQPTAYRYIPTGIVGVAGRITYDYNTKYLAEFNLGYNGSENFAPGNRYGWFPAGSLGWIVTQEDFLKDREGLNYLKVYGSLGLVGNDKTTNGNRFLYLNGPYQTGNVADGIGYNFGVEVPTNQPGARELGIGNPDVSWETAVKSNIGITAHFFNSMFELNVDFFRDNRKDILSLRQTIPGLAAMPVVETNIGRVKNQGLEAALRYNQSLGDLSFWIEGNVTFARNEILFWDEVTQPEEYMQLTGNPIGSQLLFITDGFYSIEEASDTDALKAFYGQSTNVQAGDIKYKDLNGDGIFDYRDQQVAGFTRIPEIVGGLNVNVTFRGFDLYMSWAGATNVSRTLDNIFKYPFGPAQGRSLLLHLYENRWTPETAETATLPRFAFTANSHNMRNADLYVQDASYIRLKNVEVGYNFQNDLLSRFGMSQFRVFFNGYNLLTFDKLIFNDPEANSNTVARYPITKIYNVGVKATF